MNDGMSCISKGCFEYYVLLMFNQNVSHSVRYAFVRKESCAQLSICLLHKCYWVFVASGSRNFYL
jgi:hypothetical protein